MGGCYVHENAIRAFRFALYKTDFATDVDDDTHRMWGFPVSDVVDGRRLLGRLNRLNRLSRLGRLDGRDAAQTRNILLRCVFEWRAWILVNQEPQGFDR